jgi:hypothetical protein
MQLYPGILIILHQNTGQIITFQNLNGAKELNGLSGVVIQPSPSICHQHPATQVIEPMTDGKVSVYISASTQAAAKRPGQYLKITAEKCASFPPADLLVVLLNETMEPANVVSFDSATGTTIVRKKGGEIFTVPKDMRVFPLKPIC